MPVELDTSFVFKGQDLSGQTYAFLTVRSFAGSFRRADGKPIAFWNCDCECGGKAVVRGSYLKNGHTTSCGCKKGCQKHGHAIQGKRHPLYSMWAGILQRCGNPNSDSYHNYGGRGITHDPRWADFEKFLEDMLSGWAPGLTIERMDNDGNYCKSNCKWIPRAEQLNNRRNNVRIEFEGKTLNATQWSRLVGIPAGTIMHRVHKGWSSRDALTIPQYGRKRGE